MARGYYARTIFTPTMFSRRRKGDDTVGNPRRAQIAQFELFEISLLWKLDKQFPVKRFEATVSQSAVPSPPLKVSPIGKIVQMIGDLQAKVIKEGEEAQNDYNNNKTTNNEHSDNSGDNNNDNEPDTNSSTNHATK